MAGLAEQHDEIERIVRKVLAKLSATNGRPAEAVERTAGEPHSKTTESTEASQPARLVLSDRTITLSLLAGRLENVQEIGIPPNAIITPAANDAIRERGIRLSRSGHVGDAPRQQTDGLVFGVAACAATPVGTSRLQQALRLTLEPMARLGLVEIVKEMSEHVALGGKRGLLFTTESAAALCLANRRRGVRAITGNDATEVRRAAESIAANLLIIRPDGISTWQQIELVRNFVKCSHDTCPETYREALA